MRIPGIGKLTTEAARKKATNMIKNSGIKKSKRVLEAEYMDFVEKSERSPADRIGFLNTINLFASEEAKEWIKEERRAAIEENINNSNETEEKKAELIKLLNRGDKHG